MARRPYLFFQQPASTIGCGAPGAAPNIGGASKNVPSANFGKPGSFFIASALAGSNGYEADSSNPLNFYTVLDSSQAQVPYSGYYQFSTTSLLNSAVKPSDLLALDEKIDDGIANSGNVLSGEIYNSGGYGYGGIVGVPGAGICSSGATYLANDTGYECTPLIRIGAQTGDPQ
jgi:hypothetical protein